MPAAQEEEEERWKLCIRIAPAWMGIRTRWRCAFVTWPTARDERDQDLPDGDPGVAGSVGVAVCGGCDASREGGDGRLLEAIAWKESRWVPTSNLLYARSCFLLGML